MSQFQSTPFLNRSLPSAAIPLAIATVALLLSTGCPEKRKGTSARTDVQEEVAEKVGGAPKRQMDDFNARLKRATDKQAAHINAATAAGKNQ